jgi:predicted small metal-binding protein
MKRVTCEDLGFSCDHVLEAENERELLKAAEAHARATHGVELDDDAREKLKAAIRTA